MIAADPGPLQPAPSALDLEIIAYLDVLENLELLENLEMLEMLDAPDDPTLGLDEERG